MNKKNLLLIIVSFVFFINCKIERIASVKILEESFDNVKFSYRSDSVDGVVKDEWKINNKISSFDEYCNQKSLCQLSEIKKNEEFEFQKNKEFRLQETILRRTGLKSHLKLITSKVEEIIYKNENFDLNQYYIFSEKTITKDFFMDLLDVKLLRIKTIFNLNLESLDEEEFRLLISYFEFNIDKIQKFMFESVQNAIETCNDMSQLKILLSNMH